jgi:hypothetical protein
MTWPLTPKIARVSRADMADGRFSIWNVAWVARTLVVDPLHLFDANIVYNRHYWSALSVGAGVAMLLVLPAFLPYVALQRVQGFRRGLEQAQLFSS